MLFTVFPLVCVLYFKEFLIHDSRGLMILNFFDRICWACAIFRSIPNPQARTDGQTDELIRVGLGNLRFLQVNYLITYVVVHKPPEIF